jgi:hypothetical protein
LALPNPVKELLNSKAFQRIKFGGIVGKLSLLGMVGVAVAGGIGIRASDPHVQMLCVGIDLVILLITGGGILAYGFKHPDQATLEGTELLAFQQIQQARSKELPAPKSSDPQILEGLGLPPSREGKE